MKLHYDIVNGIDKDQCIILASVKKDGPVSNPNIHHTNYRQIQYTQNEALTIATGCHKMSIIDHLHTEAEMLEVREHSELLSVSYLASCLEPGYLCNSITTRVIPKRQMKETQDIETM